MAKITYKGSNVPKNFMQKDTSNHGSFKMLLVLMITLVFKGEFLLAVSLSLVSLWRGNPTVPNNLIVVSNQPQLQISYKGMTYITYRLRFLGLHNHPRICVNNRMNQVSRRFTTKKYYCDCCRKTKKKDLGFNVNIELFSSIEVASLSITRWKPGNS